MQKKKTLYAFFIIWLFNNLNLPFLKKIYSYPVILFSQFFKRQCLKSLISFWVIVLLILVQTSAQNIIPPIGNWREHLNYQTTIQVVFGDKLYCATATNLFSVDEQGEIERYSKVSGLNDFGVQCIGWDALTQQVVVAYTNSNIDLLDKTATVKNIGDIKRSNISGNKTINSIYCLNGFAYLSTGLGIIVLDLTKNEVKDTWIIGKNGIQTAVYAFASDGNFYYAATDEGLKKISINNANPSNFANWQNLLGNGIGAGSVNNVLFGNKQIIIQKNDSLYINNGNNYTLFYTQNGWSINNISASENKVLVCTRSANGSAKIVVLNISGNPDKTIAQSGIISFPKSAILANGIIWMADLYGGLAAYGNGFTRYIPNGPPGAANGEIRITRDILTVAAGSVNSSWNYQYNRNGIYQFEEEAWNFVGYYNTPALDSVLDFISVAIDPSNSSLWGGSYGGGLVHFISGSNTPVIYKKNNSSLQPAIGDPNSFRVSGLAFDANQNLWISNYGAPQNLQVKKANGFWKGFTIPFNLLENAVGEIIIDDLNQLWIISPKNNGLVCYNYGESIDALTDDHWKLYQQGMGIGNLPSNNVLSIVKDKNGFIWVGTDKGIGIIRCVPDIFSTNGCDAYLPIIKQGQFAGLLFKDESVQCMAVDGANRKWIGTKNGVWLISPEGDKIIYRFTAENSPLLGNDVNHIAINPNTGEVFISTINGICSFRSTATAGANDNNDALVYHNPVPPGYKGTIAIRGLVENALVKITELNGRLVYQTRALGGQAIWDGHNYLGAKVASGVYLVIVRNDSNTEKIVSKIVMVTGR